MDEIPFKTETNRLTKAEISKFQNAFNLFDKDGDGKISMQELQHLMQALGKVLSEKQLAGVINRVDIDHNGTIEFPEFIIWMNTKMGNVDMEEEIGEAFSVFDKGENGFISADKMRHILVHLGSKKERLRNEEVDEMFSSMNVNDKLTCDSFIRMITE